MARPLKFRPRISETSRSPETGAASMPGSGLTSRLILTYVEREAGGQAVQEVLHSANLSEAEAQLRDENHWFSYETKLGLWSAAEEVLGDPQVAEHVGAAVLELSVAMGLKRTLRALGIPAFVYANVARANAKFNWAHQLEVVSKDATSARMRYVDLADVGYHRYDCEYTTGLLSTVPSLFDLPRAHVVHSVCGVPGGACCEFEARWTNGTQGFTRAGLAVAAGGGLLATASVLAEPRLLPVAAGVLAAGELAITARAIGFMHRRLRSLERRVAEQDDAAERLLSSFQDLSSDLRLEEVLEQITEKAQTAIGGQQFALLLDDEAGMRPERHSGIPSSSLALLASWAEAHRASLLGQGAIVIDDLATDALLASSQERRRLRSGRSARRRWSITIVCSARGSLWRPDRRSFCPRTWLRFPLLPRTRRLPCSMPDWTIDFNVRPPRIRSRAFLTSVPFSGSVPSSSVEASAAAPASRS